MPPEDAAVVRQLVVRCWPPTARSWCHRQSVSDDFEVPAVIVRTSAQGDASDIELDFRTMLASATPPAPIGELIDVALAVLGHRLPGDGNDTNESADEAGNTETSDEGQPDR
jgi:hypothetical protein